MYTQAGSVPFVADLSMETDARVAALSDFLRHKAAML
jgi:hypothetical protein